MEQAFIVEGLPHVRLQEWKPFHVPRWEAGLEGFVVFVESIFYPEKILGATEGSKQGATLPAWHSRKIALKDVW